MVWIDHDDGHAGGSSRKMLHTKGIGCYVMATTEQRPAGTETSHAPTHRDRAWKVQRPPRRLSWMQLASALLPTETNRTDSAIPPSLRRDRLGNSTLRVPLSTLSEFGLKVSLPPAQTLDLLVQLLLLVSGEILGKVRQLNPVVADRLLDPANLIAYRHARINRLGLLRIAHDGPSSCPPLIRVSFLRRALPQRSSAARVGDYPFLTTANDLGTRRANDD